MGDAIRATETVVSYSAKLLKCKQITTLVLL